MLYLEKFRFPSAGEEDGFLRGVQQTCFNTYYPFRVLSRNGLEELRFEPITILYGGNGSGKSTALNVIAEAIGASRESVFNRSSFFADYLRMCVHEFRRKPKHARVITSDDVFDYMLNIRHLNDGIDLKREDLFADWMLENYAKFQIRFFADYDKLVKVVDAKKLSQSLYVKKRLMENVRERSNGESAFLCFTDRISEDSLYLLDEPENSLSPENQARLATYLEESVRFYRCQIIMATHSPFFLALRDARIYDLDAMPVAARRWTQLRNVRILFDFFNSHREELEDGSA